MSPLVFLLAALALVAAERADLAALKPVDADALVGDASRLDSTIACLLAEDEGGCSEDGRVMRKLVYETLKNNCADCTPEQQAAMAKFMAYVSNNRPEDVPKLRSHYDPKGEFIAKYGDDLKAKGVKV